MLQLNFGFGALEADFWRWMFVMTRIGAAMFAAPLFGAATVPPQVRVIITGAVALLVCGWTPVAAPPALLSVNGMLATANEVVIGLAIGFVLQLSFAAPTLAAEMIGGGMGMSIATAADPVSGASSPALGQYFAVVLTVIFLGTGAHLNWIALLVESYSAFPPGAPWLAPGRMELITQFAGQMFITALLIALPVTLILLLVQVTTGIISRSAPSLNLFSLGLPAGVLAGLAAMIAAAPMLTDVMVEISATAVGQAAALIAQ
ncbi:MAG: flagellar biosynthetic protein FliR [Novosphingobium sp. 28-62-57]|uniref:flagellar biosynthetic protein FliR n=1 Tax=unclassified Novosphingobium TaxID=2644732 RepID=UPI000BD96412|nr:MULTISPECIES: flagellar biosynthetic protein FliR [unclassified Novosphingobium]OYW47596.1 MAG: flagellar biosynthetic protein FliR [Novosphingobium sp. 12-63-9]OYZ08827.1 MAG: flagellar biosynthetic protein FliR [Novosphingobium sp. 28-62-57]OZA36269.1 MAG: flagellar biosynthetic protein FliR [Novosphingobium sp. 17-62-9]HQS69927.1 flagellar biosynthetic protein FliR [Novosphingobium sp.]